MLEEIRDLLQGLPDTDPADGYLVSVSGGIDSMVLLHIFHSLKLPVQVAHINYHLRAADSDADADLVQQVCAESGIPFHLHHAHLEDIGNTQLQARQVRQHWLRQLAQDENLRWIVLGHHADDLLETLLLRLFQGRHPLSWSGFRLLDPPWLRPLIHQTRASITAWARTENIQWREDVSNKSDMYLRNRLRHQLLPSILGAQPEGYRRAVHRSLLQYQTMTDLWRQKSMQALQSALRQRTAYGLLLESEVFLSYNDLIIEQMLLHIHHWLSGGEPDQSLSTDALQNAVELLRSDCAGFNPDHRIRIERNPHHIAVFLQNFPRPVVAWNGAGCIIPGIARLEVRQENQQSMEFTNDPFQEWIQLPEGLPGVLRPWRNGDRIRPLGMQGRVKKVSDLMNEQHITARAYQYVLEVAGEIIWVPGVRLAESVKVTTGASFVVSLNWKPEIL